MPLMQIQPFLEKNKLARLIGRRKGRDFSHSLTAKVRVWGPKAHRIIKPRLIYRSHPVKTVSKGIVHLEGGQRLRSPKLSRTLQGSKEIVCFLGTIGFGIENEIDRLMRQDRLSEAYVLDAMGSVIVENLVEQFQDHMVKHYQSQDKAVSLRFSPGYCDWPVTEQKKLFQLMDPKPVRVELTDSCLMKPRKSISGVFGVFHGAAGKKLSSYNPCRDCKKSDCPERRI